LSTDIIIFTFLPSAQKIQNACIIETIILFQSKEKMVRGVRRGCVRLKGAVIGIDDEDDSTFNITVDGKTFHFQARGAEEREKWIRALEDTILRHAHRVSYLLFI
jgi:hypothetical protein